MAASDGQFSCMAFGKTNIRNDTNSKWKKIRVTIVPLDNFYGPYGRNYIVGIPIFSQKIQQSVLILAMVTQFELNQIRCSNFHAFYRLQVLRLYAGNDSWNDTINISLSSLGLCMFFYTFEKGTFVFFTNSFHNFKKSLQRPNILLNL